MKPSHHAFLFCILTLMTGCGSDDIPSDEEVEEFATLNQGIYGLITSYNDVGDDNEVESSSDFGVIVREKTSDKPEGVPVASTSSNDRGLYQLPLEPGVYWVCTEFLRCVWFELDEGQRLRLDYEFGPGPGWSAGEWPE